MPSRILIACVLALAACDPKAAAARQDVATAKQVIEEEIATPASAHYKSATVVASLGTRRIVHVVVDAQNKFGATLRKSLCVTYFTVGDQVKWNPDTALMDCSKPPTPDEIAAVKAANGWPQ